MEENTATPAESLYKHAIKYGVIMGVISIVLTIIFYVVSLSFMGSFKFIGLVLVLSIGIVIYGGIDYRKLIGGFMPYGKAWIHGFVIMAVAGLVGTIFGLLLYHVIDTELAAKMTEAITGNVESFMRSMGAPEDSIDKAIEQMKVDMPKQFEVGGQLLGYCKGLISYAVIALITALFVRRNEPVEL